MSPPWQHWSNQVERPSRQQQRCHQSHWIKNQVWRPSQQRQQQRRHHWSCHPSRPRLLVQSNPTRPILRTLLTMVIYRSMPKKEPYLIDFCNPIDVKSKCLKYLPDASDLPLGQESQLTFLLNNLKVKDIQMAFIKLITIVGGAATTAFLPMPSMKAKLVKDFLCLIYNHKSMMINTDETSYW